jgi:hypothetical protein
MPGFLPTSATDVILALFGHAIQIGRDCPRFDLDSQLGASQISFFFPSSGMRGFPGVEPVSPAQFWVSCA